MSSITGGKIKISVFGQSHSEAIGVVIDGLPAGVKIDFEELGSFMARRAPGQRLSTPRKETDEFEILSGLADGVTCGAPLCAVIRNSNTKPKDYSEFRHVPRPGHADYTADIKYAGFNDISGGGHFSGRLTAPLCFAGGIAKQMLARIGVDICAHLLSVGNVYDDAFDEVNVGYGDFEKIRNGGLPVLNGEAEVLIQALIEKTRAEKDSVGAVIECAAIGLPAGLGEPMFDSVESRVASLMFSVPAVKGVEFGAGFGAAVLKGSENNDLYRRSGDKIVTSTNRCGGILGGITNGMPMIFRAAFKPTPSIFKRQNTLDVSDGKIVELKIEGRHDPCVALRAVPVAEAAAAFTLLDLYCEYYAYKNLIDVFKG